jgi:hypothetical protein
MSNRSSTANSTIKLLQRQLSNKNEDISDNKENMIHINNFSKRDGIKIGDEKILCSKIVGDFGGNCIPSKPTTKPSIQQRFTKFQSKFSIKQQSKFIISPTSINTKIKKCKFTRIFKPSK